MDPGRPLKPLSRQGAALLAAALLAGAGHSPWLEAVVGLMTVLWALSRGPSLPLGPAAWWLPWLGWSAVAAAASAQPWAGLAPLSRAALALLFYAAACGWDEGEREDWLKAALAAGAVLAAAGLFAGMRGGPPPAWLSSFGGSGEPGSAAFVMLAAAAAGLGAAAEANAPPGTRRAAGAAAVLGAAGLLHAGSAAALAGLLAAAGVVAARRLGARRAALGALLLVAGAVMLPGPRERLLKAGLGAPGGRLALWRGAAAAAAEAPLHGWGPGSGRLGYLRHPILSEGPVRLPGAAGSARSEPLNAAVESGWPGAVFLLLGLVLSLSALARPSGGAAGAAAGPAAAGMAAMLLLEDALQAPGSAMLFFSALACAGHARRPWGPSLSRAAVFLPGCVLALGALAPLMRDASGGGPLPKRVWRHAQALAFYPRDPELNASLALIYEEGLALQLADERWAEAERSSPYDAVFAFRRALLADRREDFAEAERLYARAAGLEPQFRDARLGRALALRNLGRSAEAAAELAAAKSLADPGPQSYAYAAVVASRDPEPLAAVEELLKRRGSR